MTVHPEDEELPQLREALETLRSKHQNLLVAQAELRSRIEQLSSDGLCLEAERDRYAKLFEQAPDAYLVTDRHGVIRDVNEAAAALFRTEGRLLCGKALPVFFAPEARSSVTDALSTADSSAMVIEGELRVRRGNRLAVVARVTAPSCEKRLLWLLRVRTQPSNVPAVGREPEIEETSQSVTAVLSTDTKSSLNAILGWSQLLQVAGLDDATRERAFVMIERNATQQASLIDTLVQLNEAPPSCALRVPACSESGVVSLEEPPSLRGLRILVVDDDEA